MPTLTRFLKAKLTYLLFHFLNFPAYRDNKIQTIPYHFCSVTTLKKVILSQNSLKEIPSCISQLTNLSQLFSDSEYF